MPSNLRPVTAASLLRQNLFQDRFVVIAQLGVVTFLVATWSILITQSPVFNLFSSHPMLQSIAVIGFAEGVLLLQPTRSAGEKKKGLAIHQVFQLVSSLLIIPGTLFIVYNKMIHSAPHFTSWHGTFGIISLVLVFVQIIFGAIVVWSPLTRLVGGDLKAKKLWKYHRMGGYLSIVFLFATPLLAIKSDWVVGHSSLAQRAAMGLGLGATLFGIIARINFSKWGLKKATVAL